MHYPREPALKYDCITSFVPAGVTVPLPSCGGLIPVGHHPQAERGCTCCCAADDMYKLEETTFLKLVNMWGKIKELNANVEECTKDVQIAFSATIDPSIAVPMPGTSERCFGPFNTNVPIPYAVVSLNNGFGFNPTMGIFTTPRSGVYLFSFTAYSYVEKGERLYHQVQLMKNGAKVVSVWENNREDGEDSATQLYPLTAVRQSISITAGLAVKPSRHRLSLRSWKASERQEAFCVISELPEGFQSGPLLCLPCCLPPFILQA
ncbi:hypothetical protein D9C73_015483 [Collichthys lucidus]|uniref:C1q domain-containing protein n=1 Tax=Collichthys lucidus TaxID=240159 RepID=A0A4U5V1U4_COLLU|nr:hypothetical protein D9C73_015483 [Collichthys lucidus]